MRLYVFSAAPVGVIFEIHLVQGGNLERAVEWLFNHPDDMGDEPTFADVTSSGT